MDEIKKASSKPLISRPIQSGPGLKPKQRQASVQGRVAMVEQKIDKMVNKMTNTELQTLLIQ